MEKSSEKQGLATGPSERVAVGVSEAGQMLLLSRAKVFDLIRAGELPSFKIGRLRRIRVEDVRAFAAIRAAANAEGLNG